MTNLQNIEDVTFISSAAYILKEIPKHFLSIDDSMTPKEGDVLYGVVYAGDEAKSIEEKNREAHNINDALPVLFVLGKRYAPDYYEGLLPDSYKNLDELVLLSRSGLVGKITQINKSAPTPNKIKILGIAADSNGKKINTISLARDNGLLNASAPEKKTKMIVFVGTSMSSGKSFAAASCVRQLANSGIKVNAVKITGTASLRDIWNTKPQGANQIADFSFYGYPSTYQRTNEELEALFFQIYTDYAPSDGYLVVEIADGVSQRETALLLKNKNFLRYVDKLVFCSPDTFGLFGGLWYLDKFMNIKPDIISGLCTRSPLHLREFSDLFPEIPIFYSAENDAQFSKKNFEN